MAFHNSILSNVYNYYQADLSPKSTSRFDAHKRADLRSIYHSIRNIDKESPVYLIDRSVDLEKYVVHMKENAIQFRNVMDSLGYEDEETLFSKKTIVSSHPDIATVEYTGKEQVAEDFAPIELEVSSLASPQVNQGSFLPSFESAGLEGDYSFDITTGDSNYELQFSIAEGDTNYEIQSRLARLISGSGIGLNATVIQDDTKSALAVSSVSTGSSPDGQPLFHISDEDTSHKQGMVDYLGIREITQMPEWTTYTINGNAGSSPDNHLIAGRNLQVTLSALPTEPITISARPDMESVKENITAFQRSYNTFIQAASEYLHKQPRTGLLIGSMRKMTDSYLPGMKGLGISQDAAGMLQVSDEVLTSAIESGNADSALPALRNYAKASLHRISQVQLNPMDYVDKRMVAYKNPYKKHFANPYTTSAYSGMLFNSYM